MNKSILLIAYFFPPLGGPAVQRPVKFINYAKQLGWDIDVLTIKTVLFHSYDEGLLKECNCREIFRTNSWDAMSLVHKAVRNTKAKEKIYFGTKSKIKKLVRGLFLIDDKMGWMPFALWQGYKEIKRNQLPLFICNYWSLYIGNCCNDIE